MPLQSALERERKERKGASKEDAAFVALLRNHRKTLLFVLLAPKGRIRKQTVTIKRQ